MFVTICSSNDVRCNVGEYYMYIQDRYTMAGNLPYCVSRDPDTGSAKDTAMIVIKVFVLIALQHEIIIPLNKRIR